ncbi:MAG: hypothetical protein B6229_09495 [Spirochaetaceae bacterium 4572_7]|nr:MAG: hypothetical protein B6229_09495 [Spirochaetaceae bacterium 4572_7]
MKTWIQVLAGIVSGALLALLLPANSIILTITDQLSTTFLSIGRYIVLPLMFFSLIISVNQLQRNKKLLKNTLFAIGLTFAFSLLLVIVGIISSLLFSPGQIPVVIDGIQSIEIPSFNDLVKLSFPNNIFNVFQNDFSRESNQFIPFFVLAIIIGFFMTKSGSEEIEPTFNLVDSLSRIFYKINECFYKFSFIWITILTSSYITVINNIFDIQIFLPLTYMLLIITAVVILVIYPIIFYYTCGRKNLFKYILAEFPTLITATITGDQFFTASTMISSHKKNFKVKRMISGFNIPFLTLFSKSGTALVSAISFIVILKSYSSLEIQAAQILWVGSMSLLISFMLPTKGVGSSIASLFLLCSLYGHGGTMEDSFLILSPAFPIITAVSTVINTATIIMINLILDPDKRASIEN